MTQHRLIITATDGPDSWPFLLTVLGNLQREYAPGEAQVEVVAYGPRGIDLLLGSSNMAARVTELAGAGVKFLACNNTLKQRQIAPEALLPVVEVVPAGVVHLVRRQEEGWSYVKGGF